MNYQLHSYNNTPSNRCIIAKRQDFEKLNNRSTQRSSSGKKITFIRRKISNTSSSILEKQQKSILQRSQSIINHHNKSPNQIQNKNQTSIKNHNPENERTLNKLNSEENNHQSQNLPNTYLNEPKKSSQQSVKVSRGQFYEQQLNNIQKDVQFFRFELELAQQKNQQLQNKLKRKESSILQFIQNFYEQLAKSLTKKHALIFNSNYNSRLKYKKEQFQDLLKKSSGSERKMYNLIQVENDMIKLTQFLNSSFQTIFELQQVTKSQEISINKFIKQINVLNSINQNISMESQCLQQKFNQYVRQISHLSKINDQLTLASKQIKTADHSQQKFIPLYKNAEIQTQQKRIGSAASIHKYKSYRFFNTSDNVSPFKNSISPYRNNFSNSKNISSSKILIDQKEIQTPNIKLKHQINQLETVKKINVQSIKDKRTYEHKTKKGNEKKKLPATSSYINHLIQSETFIKADQTVQTIQTERNDSREPNHFNNSKSQLSGRRPIHRSRSHSQQQITSSSEKSISRGSRGSINNISSRVYSTYSLNPLNKYGEKRLCNQVNTRKIRKITQLSHQSQQLEERMKELIEEQKVLKQKYKELQKVKVSRQKKSSRQRNNSIQSKKKDFQ